MLARGDGGRCLDRLAAEFAFGAGEQATDIVAVEENDQRGDHDHHQHMWEVDFGEEGGVGEADEIEKDAAEDGGSAADDGAEGDIAPESDSADGQDGADEERERRGDEESARTRHHAASAFEADEDWKTVADEREEARDEDAPAHDGEDRDVGSEEGGADAF